VERLRNGLLPYWVIFSWEFHQGRGYTLSSMVCNKKSDTWEDISEPSIDLWAYHKLPCWIGHCIYC
jgi:hypothetical protein